MATGLVLNGTDGPDFLEGGSGDDGFLGLGGNDTLVGHEGNDTFQGASGNDRIDAGDGDDKLDEGPWDFGNDLILAGGGNDTFLGAHGDDTLNGGAGNDLFIMEYQKTDTVLATGGSGQDEFRFRHMASLNEPIPGAANYIITDFGIASDKIDVAGLLIKSSEVGFYEGGNPFATGSILRWLYDAETGDSRLQCDVDGTQPSRTWQTVLTLRDVDWRNLTAANFTGGIDPGGGPVAGQSLSGTPGADSIEGGFFNDTLAGGEGDDTLRGSGGNDSIDGGAGADLIIGGPGKDTMHGGAGDDTFEVSSANKGAIATGGWGRDVYDVMTTPFNTARNYRVTDFDTGPEGDLIDVDELINQSANPLSSDDYNFTGGNPFDPDAPFLRFVQESDGDLRLDWDRDGPLGTDHGWRAVLTLQDTLKAEITSNHIVHDLPLDGSAPAGIVRAGSENTETLEGGYGDDVLDALGGNDYVIGYLGDDSIAAGGGNDTVEGGLGNDTMFGGDGDDRFGPSGVDMQYAAKMLGDDWIFGGAGQDFLDDNYGNNYLDGGDGDDFLSAHAGDSGTTTLVGGAGRDFIVLFGDTINSRFHMADFQAGAGGDLLQVDSLLGKSIGLDGNPFAQGYLRLVQSGAHTLIKWDADGAAGTDFTFKTQLRLDNVAPANITSDNFLGQLVVGTDGNDDLVGGLGNDTVQGLEGNDTLDGSLGYDTLEGGSGDDLYYVDHVDDQVIETSNAVPGALLLPGEAGSGPGLAVAGITDTVIAAVNYSLANFAFVENLTLAGTAARATGNELGNNLKGNAGADVLDGAGGNDVLNGGEGNDSLNGGAGNDKLIGGAGNDKLVWGTGDTLDGNGGSDTLNHTAGDLDLTALPNTRIKNVERIDLTGGGNSALTLDVQDVLDISSTTDTLTVLGNAGDVVNALGFTETAGVTGFNRYVGGGAVLLIDADLVVT